MMLEYFQRADVFVVRKFHTFIISTLLTEPVKAVYCKKVAGYSRLGQTAPCIAEMNTFIEEKVILKTLGKIFLKSGQLALSLYGDRTHLYFQSPDKFIICDPRGDAGLLDERSSSASTANWVGRRSSSIRATYGGTTTGSALAVHREMLTCLHEDHHRYIRRMVCAFPRWTVCCLHRQTDGHLCGEVRQLRSKGDADLCGRKINIDMHSGCGAHGDEAYTSKDLTKVDRWTVPLPTFADRWPRPLFGRSVHSAHFDFLGPSGPFLGLCVRRRRGGVAPTPGVIPGVGPLQVFCQLACTFVDIHILSIVVHNNPQQPTTTHNNPQQPTTSHFGTRLTQVCATFVFLCVAETSGQPPAACGARLRSMLRHERQTVDMELGAAFHHSRGGGLGTHDSQENFWHSYSALGVLFLRTETQMEKVEGVWR